MPVFRSGLMILPMLALLGAAVPPEPSAESPKVLRDLLQCRSIQADGARLACFDKTTGQLAAAADQGDVRVFDKEQVNRTRRALFGFSMPSIDLFASRQAIAKPGHGSGDADEIKEITASISAVRTTSEGNYVLTLDDGSRWEQTDNVSLGRDPRPGGSVAIKRGVLGSYKMSIGNGPAMKVRRTS